MSARWAVLGLAATVIAFGRVGTPAAAPARLTVYAASSLTEVFQRLDPHQRYSFAGSNQLSFQIGQGAPADVFASASPKYTQSLYRDGLVERPRAFATNSLVLIVPRSNPAGLHTVFDVRRKGVKLVVGTASVPIGSYTREVLRRLGLAGALANVVSQEPDVKAIVAKVALGQADAGFVYATDVKPVAGRVTAIRIPARGQPTVRYEAAVVASSGNKPAARAWVEKLVTQPRTRRLLRAAGFGLP